MQNFMNKIRAKANSLAIRAKTTIENVKAEGYVDTGVKIIIAVVVGAVILGGLYALFDNVILPTLENPYRRYVRLRRLIRTPIHNQ